MIPSAEIISENSRIKLPGQFSDDENRKILFSFAPIDRNEYFNLDGTCANWASDLFETIQKVSDIRERDILAGAYSGKNSTLRIHRHKGVIPPCRIPHNISMEDMWQIRISINKGGIHGVLTEGVFYVVWFDPHHNLYPRNKLRKVIPPSTCCKDRDVEIENLKEECDRLKNEAETWTGLAESYANSSDEQ